MAAPPEDPKASVERMRTLLGRWRQSLELHTRYLQLDDQHYWHVQPWPSHERPAAWIVQLARQKVAELSRALEEHSAGGDAAYAVGLEHMAFLANLVGLQPAGRHIPLADPLNEQREAMPPASGESVAPARAEDHATREMPRPRLARQGLRAARASRAAHVPAPTASLAPAAPAASATPRSPPLSAETRQVIEDAVRLLQWGRKWHELGELVSRLSGRPAIGEARRILRTHRAQIEAAALTAGP